MWIATIWATWATHHSSPAQPILAFSCCTHGFLQLLYLAYVTAQTSDPNVTLSTAIIRLGTLFAMIRDRPTRQIVTTHQLINRFSTLTSNKQKDAGGRAWRFAGLAPFVVQGSGPPLQLFCAFWSLLLYRVRLQSFRFEERETVFMTEFRIAELRPAGAAP